MMKLKSRKSSDSVIIYGNRFNLIINCIVICLIHCLADEEEEFENKMYL